MFEAIAFWSFGGLTLGLAILVIVLKNPVHCAMALIGNLFCIAALFVLLNAHFLAVIQVLVYAGAILVLFLFVIMLLNLKPSELGQTKRTIYKALSLAVLVWVGISIMAQFVSHTPQGMPPVSPDYGTLETVGRLIFGAHVLPFEVASILLLAAILGSVSIAKKKIW